MQSKGALFLAPRILAILYALFLGLFALDVFSDTHGLLETVAALALHLLPTFLIILVVVLAWRRDLVGVVVFAGLAVAYVVWMWRRFPLHTYVVMCTPLLLVSFLFLLSWRQRIQVRKPESPRSY